MIVKLTVLSICFGLCTLVGQCQYFTDLGYAIGLNVHVFDNLHGAGVSFADFNQDGWDDLTFCEDGVVKFYQNAQGVAQLQELGINVDENAKHPIWVDFDNDEDLDFFITQKDYPNRLFEHNADGSYTDITAQAGLPLFNNPSYGASWGDYDNDGDLDLYVCNYVYIYEGDDSYEFSNHLYRNNGDGTFSDITLQSNTSDGISLSFQSVWFDADRDGWMDLFVINDLEHPNRFYHNNGDGTFSDLSEESGLDLPIMDAMSASVGDFNNDGWFDLFITNVAIQSCALMQNNGDLTFANVANTSGVTLGQLCWGAMWLDYDYDRDQDLYVCENHYAFPDQHNPLLRNEGDNTFTNIGGTTLLFDQSNSYCCATGDWNNDGYVDIAVNNWEWDNAAMWQNSGAAGGVIVVSLEGVFSNSMGAGASISLWADGVVDSQLHMVGQNYMGQNSLNHHFGTAGFNQLDSLVVVWPSGIKDVLHGPNAGGEYHIIEGSWWNSGIDLPNDLAACSGDSVDVILDTEWDVLWDNGSTASEVFLEPGPHTLLVSHPLGLTDSISFVVDEIEVPELEAIITDISCFGADNGSIELTGGSADSVVWASGIVEWIVDSLSEGWQMYESFFEGCSRVDSLYVSEPMALEVQTESSDVLCFGAENGIYQITTASGGVPPYYDSESNLISTWPHGSASLGAGEYSIELFDSNGCSWSETAQINEPEELTVEASADCENGLSVEIEASGGAPPYSYAWSDGTVEEDLMNSSELCANVVVYDFNQCEFVSEDWCCETSIDELHQSLYVITSIEGSRWLTFEYLGNLPAIAQLYDLSGKLVFKSILTSPKRVQTEVPSSGIYLFCLSTGGQIYTRKLGFTP